MKPVKAIIIAVLLFFVTVAIGILAEGVIGVQFNMAGVGSIVSVALVGAIILYATSRKGR